MVISKPLIIAYLFISSFLVHTLVEANKMVNSIDGVATNTAKIQNIDCGGACASRCKLSSRPNLCKRACGTCCARCSCVPPGTSGGYDACPCYASMTTHGGRRKCP
ncbi:gibberellin-regulated protein 1-like isoform X1 [Benincasa hispida]|uniref:gibberellin-regulated protein 1-like isoform X1 n=1 Tax=Benincasa hispida TaxID=102211 RepID=UPI0018FF36AC|nr:gibberellin-regulated protein 1-like isoform X1 [Benincasa hispida]